MNVENVSLSIKLFELEAVASGDFAVYALVIIVLIVAGARWRRL